MMHKRLFALVLVFGVVAGGTVRAADPPDLLKNTTQTLALVKEGKRPVWQETLVLEGPGTYTVVGRVVFAVKDPSAFTVLEFHKPLKPLYRNLREWEKWFLNGNPVPVPIEKMYYRIIPGIPASLLRKGENVLTTSWRIRVRGKSARIELNCRLLGLGPEMLSFQTGPVLGCARADYFTVTCRTNITAAVTLSVDGRTYASKPGFMHAFRPKGLKAETEYAYTLKAVLPNGRASVTAGPFKMRTFPPKGKRLLFAAVGDNRSNPKTWARVAKAVAGHRPAFTVHLGDFVGAGILNWHWREQFFGPAKGLLATVPNYFVMGNHERDAPIFLRMLRTPNGKKNWAQEIGPVLLIGIDGLMYWRKHDKTTKWLEGVLSESKAKFIFLCSHYPPWSSCGHGGRKETDYRYVREARYVIMPLLKKYNVTAMLGGHWHHYERSEPDDGVTVIVSGGAGAPLSDKTKNPKIQNPYSKAFAKKFHYCLFSIAGDTCTMKALTLEGKVIDTRQWKARKVKEFQRE